MADKGDNAKILVKIQDSYIPFLTKLIAFLTKKNEKSQKLEELKSIYTTFTSAPVKDQIKVYNANKMKLDKWHKMYQGKRGENIEGNDSSQEASENTTRSTRKKSASEIKQPTPSDTSKHGSNSTGFLSIVSVRSVSETDVVGLASSASEMIVPEVTNKPITTPIHIKKEGDRGSTKQSPHVPAVNARAVTGKAAVSNVTPSPVKPKPDPPAPVSAPADDGPVTFVCASCQFNTVNETEFTTHAKNDHKNELSLWCKQCWRCFSNIGFLVGHIKERSCQKEEMIYKCGVKDCTFEVSSGQTFVHHLRHCHKGSPFIFCVHCQKIFTLPHCLILHMQNECPYKERNRKNPGSVDSTKSSAQPVATPVPVNKTPTVAPIRAITPNLVKKPVVTPKAVTTPSLTTVSSVPTGPSRGRELSSAGRRGRTRGRGRLRVYESSDSEDADDPSWCPDYDQSNQPVRRSARWAKKVNDARNPDISDVGADSRKKSITSEEIYEKNLLSCPCCDFMAAIKSVLDDHYIGIHKAPNKNACLVCNVKFENVMSFLDHFQKHAEEKAKEPVVSEEPKRVAEPAPVSVPRPVHVPKPAPRPAPAPVMAPQKSMAVKEKVQEAYQPTRTVPVTENTGSSNVDSADLDCIVENIVDGHNVVNPTLSNVVKIPYQAAIHEKNQKDAKMKKFEDLKSPRDLLTLKEESKLKHFFKCISYNCTFTTDDPTKFVNHFDTDHKGRRLHCGYCLQELFSGTTLKDHMLREHGKRRYQCSSCFYRAYSIAHVQIHIKNMHSNEETKVYTCELQEALENESDDDNLTTTWPYVCAVGDCKFQTYDPQEFKKHNETTHRTVSVFFCYYCKVDFISFKRLMDHYRLHGINTFQCTYCVHGSDTKDEILQHLCNVHADKPFKAHFRAAQDTVGSRVKTVEIVSRPVPVANKEPLVVSKEPPVLSKEPSVVSSIPDQSTAIVAQKQVDTVEVANKKQDKREPTVTFIDLPLKAVKQEKLKSDAIENEFYDTRNGKYYPKRVHRISSDFFCGIPFCNQQFKELPFYISHLKKNHSALNIPCPHCPTSLEDVTLFKNHLLCHGPTLYACSSDTCCYYDWNTDKIMFHVKEHAQDGINKISIRECHLEDSTAGKELSKIESTCLEPILKSSDVDFQCLFCQYKSSNRAVMKNHVYMEIAYKRFSCNLCKTKFFSRNEVSKHFIANHADVYIQCAIESSPEIEFVVKNILTLKEQNSNLSSPRACENCSKTFTGLTEWQHHLRLCIFNQYCPYDCNYCKKGFSDLRILKFHSDKKHTPNMVSFTVVTSVVIEEEIYQKLQQSRLKYLQELVKRGQLSGIDLLCKLESKLYRCSICPYSAHFKFNVESHIKASHEGNQGKVEKVVTYLNLEKSFPMKLTNEANDNSKTALSSNSTTDLKKRYRCSFCIKKTITLQELQIHVEGHHPVRDQSEYPYFFWPDVNQDFSPSDKELYGCGYCNVNRVNLYNLKNHSILHPEAPFNVKGYVSRYKEVAAYIACGYCYKRLPYNDLKYHTDLFHPSKALKSINDFQSKSLKRKADDEDTSSNKKVKLGTSAFLCSHCGGVFPTLEQVLAHCKHHHSRLPSKYEKLSDQLPKSGDAEDVEFFRCEFCPFISSKKFLDKHMATKHKTVIACSYCGKRFEYATKLKEHHDAVHNGLKWVMDCHRASTVNSCASDGTVEQQKTLSRDSMEVSQSTSSDGKIVSHYGKEPEPIDLSSVTVLVSVDQEQHFIIPVSYLYQKYRMFPVVLVEDFAKQKK